MRASGAVTEAAGAPPSSGSLMSLEGLAVGPTPGLTLLQGLDLAITPGECIALVGPSGSGKTTLLRTLSGQIPPLRGQVRLGEQPFSSLGGASLRRARTKVALIAQKHDLVDVLPVHANVMAGALGRWSNLRALRYLLRPSAEELREAASALASVGLAEKLLSETWRLSGGEQQRVAVARALVQAPLVLLADEPVASLDPQTAREVLGMLTRLAQDRGLGLIASLHQPELATTYFDRVLELRAGGLQLVRDAP